MVHFFRKTLVILFLIQAVLSKENLIPSGSFEEQSGVWTLNLFETALPDAATLDFPQNSYNNSTCAHITVKRAQAEDWYVQLPIPQWYTIANAIYRLSFYGKGSNPIQISISYGKDVPPPFKEFQYKEGFKFTLTDSWQKYSGEFSSNLEGFGLLDITINLGEYSGEFSIDDIVLEEIDQIDQWNTWYTQADQRIEQIRKGEIELNGLVDPKGNPINKGTAHIKLRQHDFKFGTSVIFADTVSESDNNWYREKIRTLFNSITPESALKWPDYEPVKGEIDTADLDKYTNFADSNSLNLRGHELIWAIQKFGFENHWAEQGTDQQLKDAIKSRIIRDVTRFKGKIHEYDVWNEPFHEPAWFTRLNHLNSNPNNYWELLDSAFIWARSADSTADLYINEYAVVEGGQTSTLMELVRGMLERKVPITGIGAQCHFENNPIEPELIRKRLDTLAQLGLKIRLTEFDLGSPEDGVMLTEKQLASEYAKFFRTAFSHPAVSGITLWGFWDRLIWNSPKENSIGTGLFNTDKTAKESADSLINLLQHQWNTDTTIELQETKSISGFYGTYDISLTTGTETYNGTFSLKPDYLPDTIRVTWNSTVKNSETEKIAQRFFAITDSRGRAVTISGACSEYPVIFQLLDLRGRRIHQSIAERTDRTIFSFAPLPEGVYVMKIMNGHSMIQQKLLLTR